MPNYCVNTNAQPNGDHEVHDTSSTKGCLPSTWNRKDLGYHSSCTSAVQAARSYYNSANGCAVCAPLCHTS